MITTGQQITVAGILSVTVGLGAIHPGLAIAWGGLLLVWLGLHWDDLSDRKEPTP